MGHIRGTSRCARRGSASLTPLAKALAKFGFFAPLTEDVFLDKGYGAASFTRATTATVVDHEGCIRNCLSGEVRFHGQRRVENVAGSFGDWATTGSGSLTSCTSATGATDPQGGTTACTITATGPNASARDYSAASIYIGKSCRNSIWLRRRTGTGVVKLVEANNAGVGSSHDITAQLTTSWQRFAAPVTVLSTGYIYSGIFIVTSGDEVDIWHNQMEVVTGQSNQNPSEYVSVGAAKLNELRETENVGTSPWVLTNATITNGVAATNPTVHLQKVASTAAGLTRTMQDWTATATTYCITLYGKKGTSATTANGFRFRNNTTPADLIAFTINWDTGVITHSLGSGVTSVDCGDGVWRIVIPVSSGVSVGNSLRIYALDFTAGAGGEYAYIGGVQATPGTTSATTYFPVGNVYPFHGACVDGVRYFSTLNGNTVASYIVTEATGAAITRPENDGLTNGLVLPGVAGNYASAPDSAAISITGDIEIQIKVRLSDYTPGSNTALVTKHETAGQKSFNLWIATTGILVFAYSPDGTATIPASASAATGVTDGDITWFKTTFVSATGKVNFYKSTDGSAWSAIGVEQTIASGSIFNGTDILRIGSGAANVPINGTVYRTVIKSGIDGTTVFDADFSAQPLGTTTFTESSSNAATVTINRSGAVPAYIGNPLRLFNYEGYLAESARTNLVLQSSNFGTTWTAVGTPTRSAAAAYCGEIALDLIGDDSAAVTEGYQQTVGFTADAAKSVSFLVKQGTSSSTVVRVYDSTAVANRLLMAITWSGGIPVCTYTTGSAERAPEAMANGCWRIFCATASLIAANTNIIFIYAATDAAISVANTGDIYIGGVQAENATTASVSHIPTTTATVTRNADGLNYPAAGNTANAVTSLCAESFITVYTSLNRIASISNTADRNADLYWLSGTAISSYSFSGGLNDGSAAGSPSIGSWQKVSTAVQLNDGIKVINGVLGTPDATVTPSGTVTVIRAGEYAPWYADGIVRNIRVSSTRVPNADLQLITT